MIVIFNILPFGLWRGLDDSRFDTVDALARLKFYLIAPYDGKNIRTKIERLGPSWMQEQIKGNLASISPSHTSKESLDSYMSQFSKEDLQKFLLVRFTIKKGEIIQYPQTIQQFQGRLTALHHALEILLKENLLPEGLDFIVCINDKIFEGYRGEIPIFVFSKDVSDARQRNLILIPDGMNLSRWAYHYPTIRFANFIFPWAKKKNTLLWRGSNTNPIRERVVQMTLPFLDAVITDGRDQSYMIPEYQIQFKYLLSLDGISSTWPGLLWKLASNSVTFKQASSHQQWYYGGIKPGVHYVEVQKDLSDLEAEYQWAESHPQEAQIISDNAQAFVRDNLTYEEMLHYLARVFNAYKKIPITA